MSKNRGAVDSANTTRAGCGIRYEPEQLGEDTGFDFSGVAGLLKKKKPSKGKDDSTKEAPENNTK